MENNNKKCLICSKSFSNGKALGGHMKSHLANLPIPPKPAINNQVPKNLAESTNHPIHPLSASSSLTVHPRNNPIHNLRSLRRNFYFTLANYGRNDEFESYPKNPTRKRSKRNRKNFDVAEKKVEHTQRSSTSDDLSAEDAANILVIMKKWPTGWEIKTQQVEEKANKEETKIVENGEDDSLTQTQFQAMFKCEMCPKMFESYQAFVIHKAHHEKMKNLSKKNDKSGNNSNIVDQKVHECPHCSKIFKSSQALEEHKKVHLSNSMVANTENITDKSSENFADFNFPTPTKVEETSHIEFSTVSKKE